VVLGSWGFQLCNSGARTLLPLSAPHATRLTAHHTPSTPLPRARPRQEFRKGFAMGDRLLRPAMVQVSFTDKPAETPAAETQEESEGEGEGGAAAAEQQQQQAGQ